MSYIIRRMKPEELIISIQWAAKEGWNPGISDADSFYYADPQGFFAGLLDDKLIATGAAVIYDDHFAFCGLYIVKDEYRGQGYGIQLTNERLKYVGDRITGLDGVLENVSKYERLGYKSAHRNIRYELSSPKSLLKKEFDPSVVDLNAAPFVDLEKFDRRYFPAPRSNFLKNWMSQPDAYALGYVNVGVLQGYGVIRKCEKGYKIGPLFAETELVAEKLFVALGEKVSDGPIYLDIPEPNQHAQALVKKYGMKIVFEVIRMYRNGFPDIDLEGIYGITTFELG